MNEENVVFGSILGPAMQAYINVKRQQNTGVDSLIVVLKELDRMREVKRLSHITLTRDIYLKWFDALGSCQESTRCTKALIFKQFAQYLCLIGFPSYVPPQPRRPHPNHVPHIYSEEEIGRIFSAIDNTLLECKHNTTCLIALPTIFRFLYYCGARVGEVLEVKNEDVDLERGVVILKRTKNRKHRLIPLNEQMTEVLCTYLHYRDKMPISSAVPESYLFTNHRGEKLSTSAVYIRFKETLRRCGIFHKGHGDGPRVHDLRHTFAVHSVHYMVKSGLDIYTAWPILSTLLGHKDIYATEHYIRLALEVYPDLYQAVGDKLSSIFPDL